MLLKFSKVSEVKIVQIGDGGTGSYVSPKIYRTLYAEKEKLKIQGKDRHFEYIHIDRDTVSQSNILRQNFAPTDVGENKAKIMAERYGYNFSIEPRYYQKFIMDVSQSTDSVIGYEDFVKIITPRIKAQDVILIGCVDNITARQMIHKAFHDSRITDLVYIDSGNGDSTGQVVCGVKRKGEILLQPVCYYYPEMLTSPDDWSPEPSCGDVAVGEPQSMSANDFAATSISAMISNIICLGELAVNKLVFSSYSLSMRPTYIEDEVKSMIKAVKKPATRKKKVAEEEKAAA